MIACRSGENAKAGWKGKTLAGGIVLFLDVPRNKQKTEGLLVL